MTDLAPIMTSPRLKVQRAYRHIDELRQRSDPLDRELYRISILHAYHSVISMYPVGYELTYRPKEPIPETFALIIGDTVHNLRAALDHLAKGILRTWGEPNPDPKKRFYFPLAPRKDLPAHAGVSPIEKALPGTKELLLQKIRPDNGPDEPLWAFNALDNDDKHSLVVPTVTLIEIRNINAWNGHAILENFSVSGDAARPTGIMQSGSPITIQDDFKTTVDVKFGQGTPFENDPVVPTLIQIAQVVEKTLDAFEGLIRATKRTC